MSGIALVGGQNASIYLVCDKVKTRPLSPNICIRMSPMQIMPDAIIMRKFHKEFRDRAQISSFTHYPFTQITSFTQKRACPFGGEGV